MDDSVIKIIEFHDLWLWEMDFHELAILKRANFDNHLC